MAKIIDRGFKLPEGVNEGDFSISLSSPPIGKTDTSGQKSKRGKKRRTSG
jgi:hypothetical protein